MTCNAFQCDAMSAIEAGSQIPSLTKGLVDLREIDARKTKNVHNLFYRAEANQFLWSLQICEPDVGVVVVTA